MTIIIMIVVGFFGLSGGVLYNDHLKADAEAKQTVGINCARTIDEKSYKALCKIQKPADMTIDEFERITDKA